MNKIYKIIKDNFDLRVDAMVISYLMDKGISFCSKITDSDIESLEGNNLMSKEFTQDLVKTARLIARECNLFDDIIPYIIMEMPNNGGINYQRMNEIACLAIDGLIEDGMYEAKEYFRDTIEMDEDEAEWFGIEKLYEEEDK